MTLGWEDIRTDVLRRIRSREWPPGALIPGEETLAAEFGVKVGYNGADLMKAAGLDMPAAPTWDFIKQAAEKMTDKSKEQYGICLRGKAGWGENMAFLTAMSNSYGARWFDENWKPQFDQPEWKATLDSYLHLMNEYGPPGASNNGFNENLTLFQQGHCGMWIDATVAASFVTGKDSTVADKVGFALAPDNGLGKRGNWLWA